MTLTHLEVLPTGETIGSETPVNAPGGKLLYARYDLARIKSEMSREDIARGPDTLWRYAALLPLSDPRNAVTLGEGWTPVVKAFDEGKAQVEPWGALDVPPGGLKSPNPPAGAAVLAILMKYGGAAISVTTEEALREVDEIAARERIFACPESATTTAGLRKAIARGVTAPTDRVVAVCTGSGLKSIPTLPAGAERKITSAADIV